MKSSAALPCAPTGVESPPLVVTTTDTRPALTVAGDTAVMLVGLFTVTLVAEMAPNFTVAPVMKPLPAIATDVPPVVGPDVGDSDETVIVVAAV